MQEGRNYGVHSPFTHVSFVPQLVPFATSSPVDTQIACPKLQDVIPIWQGLPLGAHAVPAVHATQLPLEQTSFVPHAVPLATFSIATQVARPEPHTVVPVTQGLFAGVHTAPAAHATQLPPEQTSLVPHAVPLAISWPVDTQVCTPELQDVIPV
jgi:hypothetical protein